MARCSHATFPPPSAPPPRAKAQTKFSDGEHGTRAHPCDGALRAMETAAAWAPRELLATPRRSRHGVCNARRSASSAGPVPAQALSHRAAHLPAGEVEAETAAFAAVPAVALLSASSSP